MISVLMPVYNAAPFVGAALHSVLAGLGCGDEVLVLDDGSTDGSQQIVASLNDNRIRHIQNPVNIGVAATLNRGLAVARGEFVARMDADDLCRPDRFATQVKFMEDNPTIGLVGGWVRYLGRYQGYLERKPSGESWVKASMLFDNPIIHPTVMFRRDIFAAHSLAYDSSYSRSEDFDLWTRCSRHMAIDNIPKVLVDFRVHEASVTHTARTEMEQQTVALLRRQLATVGIDLLDNEALLHRRIGHGEILTRRELSEAEGWIARISRAAELFPGYTASGLFQASRQVWMRLCTNNACHGVWLMRRCLVSPLFAPKSVGWNSFLRFLAACLWYSCRKTRK